jgi:translocation and assembly module TamB
MQLPADAENLMDSEPEPFRGWRWKYTIFAAVTVLFAVLILVAWAQRNSIADRFVQSELASRGIRATYTIDQSGHRGPRAPRSDGR